MNDIANAFRKYFDVIIADTPALLEEVYRLRYEVLCIEERAPGFEASQYPDGLEKDEYDDHSSCALLRHRSTNTFVGSVRLILPDPLHPGKKFPAEMHAHLDPQLIDIDKIPRQSIAEISRFIVAKNFLKRKSERRTEASSSAIEKRKTSGDRRRFPYPMLGLVIGIMRLSLKHNISHWLSVMDPALNKLLGFSGLQFDPVGPLSNYHGMRRPYHFDVTRVLARTHEDHREIWELLTDNGKAN